MSAVRKELEKRYEALFTDYHLEQPLDAGNIGLVIRRSLNAFLKDAVKPAVYCNGGHTEMLMADFMYELKKVKYIVDNYATSKEEHGFTLIRDEEIEAKEIDAIVLSSYKFRTELKEALKKNHPDIPVLDIYDEFEKERIVVQSDYYYSNHPYQHYKRVNQLQREIKDGGRETPIGELYLKLVTKYIHIKDFRTAIIKLKEWKSRVDVEQRELALIEGLLADVETLYELQKKAAESLSETHVLMLCLDGLRREDLSELEMPRLKRLFDETGYQFTNGYSFSTSTFEGLIPVYEENSDLRTEYYKRNSVKSGNCRFVSLAKSQGRDVFIYGDGEHYIEDESIHYTERFLTVTEKIWQFILDACAVEKGLFYVHELYESHFTFSNPYTESALRSEGTAMLFDFLPMKGGHLRSDYARQHADAIHYLDDVLEPLLRPMKCRMLVFADHGNLILDYDAKLSEVGDMEYTCSEGWTRVPIILRSSEMGAGKNDGLISLMELNNIVVSLLSGAKYKAPDKKYIKMARSKIYNPDFQLLYRMVGKEKSLQAFECFLFADGKKLMVYADGTAEIYDKDVQCVHEINKTDMIKKVYLDITVCESIGKLKGLD